MKYVLMCVMFLMPVCFFGQIKKVNSLKLSHFSDFNRELDHFEAKGNNIYISSATKIYRLDSFGIVRDSVVIYDRFENPAFITYFDVKKDSVLYKPILYCYENHASNLYLLSDTSVLKNINLYAWDTKTYSFTLGNNNIYHAFYFFDTLARRKNFINIIDSNNVVTEKEIIGLDTNYITNFKVADSICVFSTKGLNNINELIFTDTIRYGTLKKIDVLKRLGLDIKNKSTTRIISFNGHSCLFVTSLIKSKIDIIAIVNFKTGNVTELIKLKGSMLNGANENIAKSGNQGIPRHLYSEYPNRLMYSMDGNNLSVIYFKNKLYYVDKYYIYRLI